MVLRTCLSCMLIAASVTGCSEQTENHDDLFQAELDRIVSSKFDWTPGISMSVYAPSSHIDWSGQAGVFELSTFADVSDNQPFRIASITKSFTAVSILRLHEEGLLSIDDPIQKHISDQHDSILVSGGYDTNQISIRHCLNSTSGIYDYVLGTRENPSPYVSIIANDPNRRWTRTDQLKGAIEWGEPQGNAGEKYHYSDTGYILLGEIIERLSNKSLGDAMEYLVNYKRLGLHSTWLESLQEARTETEPIHSYYQRKDYSLYDASIDLYGGGGLISTTQDLSRFYYHLFNGGVFENNSTTDLMLSRTEELVKDNAEAESEDYRLGVQHIQLYDSCIYAHSGLWDTYVLYSPKHNAAVAVKFTDGGGDYLLKRVISIIENILESNS
ncbi:MAG: serine hydrolase domain-containing protein [Bacteroidota bacterium]